MGFKKDAPVAVAEKPAAEAPKADEIRADGTNKYTDEERRVHGQVRMHGIIAGYKVAAQLAPTLANTASGIKDELHKLAAEVAAKIEEYSFI